MMSRYLKKDLKILRGSLVNCIKKSKPADKVSINLILSIIWLHFLADREGKIKNPKERRRIIHEFKRGKKALEEGIRYVSEEA